MVEERFGLRDALRALSEAPKSIWPAGVIHHGARALMLVGVAALVSALFPVAPVPDFPVLERGMVAEEDIIAQVGFPIYKSGADLARERADAAAGVAPILEYVPGAVDTMLARVDRFNQRLDSVANLDLPPEVVRERMRDLLGGYAITVGDDVLNLLMQPGQRALLAESVERAIRLELPAGIVQSQDLESGGGPHVIRGETDRIVPRDSVLTAARFYERASQHQPGGPLSEFHNLILIRFFEPSLRLNREATEATRERAREAVPEERGEVLRGERIVRAHEQVGDAEIERLRAYQSHLAETGQLGEEGGGRRVAGAFLLDLLTLSVIGVLLFFFRPAIYRDFRHVLLIGIVTAAFLGAAAVIGHTEAPIELIPIAFPALVVAALWDGRMALNMVLLLAILLSGQAPLAGTTVLFTTLIGGAAAAFSVRVVRSRSQTWVFIAIIAAAYLVAVVTLGLLRARDFQEILWGAGWGGLNAIGSSLIAMGFLPLLESFTRVTTDQTLLELSDLNRPLLKRLSLEAPGTYAHSINVANLAESAARAIGANALLTRVGVYYHDVGKMAKPQYFIENQPPGRNPHDKMKPATSAAIVRGHVAEGMKLAEEAKLPDCVKAFIAEHHGTQPVSFFLDRAQELDPDAELKTEDFAYPGPLPRSKETAITMLADSVESAARVLQDPSPEGVRALVDRIVDTKIAQGQLDAAPLTLGEVSRIKAQFTNILNGMFHQRIDYPTTQRERQEPEPKRVSQEAAASHR